MGRIVPADDAVIDAYLDALWLEKGLAANSLAAYRRDLTAFARHAAAHGASLLRADKATVKGALAGITAAVVGVILNLALVFGVAVIWPRGVTGETNWFAAVMSIAAFFALYRLKADVFWLVIAGGLIGLGWALLIR